MTFVLAALILPFAFFGLWETTLAVGAGAASIPIIIHLLNRRRHRVVIWAAMKFLLKAQKQNTRRMRLEQLLLLLLRITVVVLIVIAMASVMPWAESLWANVFPDAGFIKTRPGRTHKIIVLDGSLSMALRVDGDRTAFDKARDIALQIVNDSPAGDGFSVALLKDAPTWIVGEPSQDARKVADEIRLIQQAHGNANVPALLNMLAAKLAESSNRFTSREVYLLTDLQKATWSPGEQRPGEEKKPASSRERTALQEIQKRARTIFVDVGKEGADNVAIMNLTLGDNLISTGQKVPITATLHHFGLQPRNHIRVELLTGLARGKNEDAPFELRSVTHQTVSLKPGEMLTVPPFQHAFSAPGTYAVQVRIEGDDLGVDDQRTVIVTVKETIPVLLVNGKPAPDPFDRATEYLKLALNPFGTGPIPKNAPLRPRVVTVSQFADENESKLAGVDCIFLCDVGQLGGGEIRRLKTHLLRGGGVIVSLGDEAAGQINLYNRLLVKEDNLLPAELLGTQSAPKDHYFSLHAEEKAFLEPPLKAFADSDDRAALLRPRFRRYVRARVGSDPRIRTILTYMPEVEDARVTLDRNLTATDPALLEWNPPLPPLEGQPKSSDPGRYRGKVLLFTSTLNMDWNSWPRFPSYMAMVQELTRLALVGRLREHSSIVNQPLEEWLLSNGNELNVTLYPPGADARSGKRTRTQGLGDVTAFRWSDTDTSGIYRLTVGQDPQDYLFAVNVPSATADQKGSESDLRRVTQEQLQSAYPGLEFQLVTDPSQVQRQQGTLSDDGVPIKPKVGPVIANYLLLVVLGLLLLEVVLAWSFGHYSSALGSNEPAASGTMLPTVVGTIAAGLFVVIAGVLLHAWWTGNFLGFLPDFARSSIEAMFDVAPAAPGESSIWSPSWESFLRDPGSDPWLAGVLALAAAALVFFIYRQEGNTASPCYKALLGGLRLFVILLMLVVLLPQLSFNFERRGWPDLVLLIDDSLSMGEADQYQDEKTRERAQALGEKIRKDLQARLPERLKQVRAQLEEKRKALGKVKDAKLEGEINNLAARVQALQTQQAQVNSPSWRPTRLQLALALLTESQPDWLARLVHERQTKLHVYRLDPAGRAIKLLDTDGQPVDILDAADEAQIEHTRQALARLEPHASESRLGTALRQILDHYRGAALSAVIALTDGVTTRDETIGQVAEYAGQKGVPLFLIGIGDDQETRDLRLHDLQVEDTVYVGDNVIFEARLTGHGFKDLVVPVILKVKEKDGTEKELDRKNVKVHPGGKTEKVTLRHQSREAGEKLFIVEAVPPRQEANEKPINNINLRLQRTVFVQDTKTIKVLYVEGTARYEYRFLKALLERESPGAKGKKTIELKVLLLDADDDFAKQDRSALAEFPLNKVELFQYDVVILGDCDPRSPKLGEPRLRDLVDFVRERGGGFLALAGPFFNPHAYRTTPLADILPVEPADNPPVEPEERTEGYRLDLTPVGRLHPIFRLVNDDGENASIWSRLAPMYWHSEAYKPRPVAEVLAVHPKKIASLKVPQGQDSRLPLAVQNFVGGGRTMFFGFDESWRWRFREDEIYFNKFWQQTVRYLSRSRVSRTELRLDKQTPYRQGEPIKVTVRFPDNTPMPGQVQDAKAGLKTEVKVIVEYRPHKGKGELGEVEVQTLTLAKVEGSWATYEGLLHRTRSGKYCLWLSQPDVSKQQPDGKKPSAEAEVVLPPGEVERLRMNREELKQAAAQSNGRFYTLLDADRLIGDLPPGVRVSLNTASPPFLLWNHPLCFLLVLSLLTSEWWLRKRKHLL